MVVRDDNVDVDDVDTGALYVTCRPDRPDDVPSAVLSGTRGRPPPVLAARYRAGLGSFPFEFHLMTPTDVTVEGSWVLSDGDRGDYWWARDDDGVPLIVSVRWDTDGVAATRSPDDLVGRGWTTFQGIDVDVDGTGRRMYTPVTIELSGRGAFGKFVTGGGRAQ
jgi:hypothetical protein